LARIVIIAATPLLASGLLQALVGVDGWMVSVQAEPGAADVVVWQSTLHGADLQLPAGTAAVLLGEALEDFANAHDARALALLPPAATPAQLRAAVAAVLQGLSVRAPGAAWSPAGSSSGAPGAEHEPLTPRELEVYELLGKGLSNRDIGGVLGISAHTAKYHVGQILAKVGAATRAEAVSTGLRWGLIGL
jgi:DNA-binding CsgD family transcriptional regulator